MTVNAADHDRAVSDPSGLITDLVMEAGHGLGRDQVQAVVAAVAGGRVPSCAPLARYPAVVADLTVRHKLSLPYADLAGAVRGAGPSWLEDVAPVVRYRGEGVAADEVKTTLRLVYRHPERTLTQDEVNAAHFALMDTLARMLAVSFQ